MSAITAPVTISSEFARAKFHARARATAVSAKAPEYAKIPRPWNSWTSPSRLKDDAYETLRDPVGTVSCRHRVRRLVHGAGTGQGKQAVPTGVGRDALEAEPVGLALVAPDARQSRLQSAQTGQS